MHTEETNKLLYKDSVRLADALRPFSSEITELTDMFWVAQAIQAMNNEELVSFLTQLQSHIQSLRKRPRINYANPTNLHHKRI